MSTSEHENQKNKEWDNLFPSTIEPSLPADFSEEDVLFAQELNTLFSPSDEILPPYYAQTLLQAEDPRYSVADDAFARKTSARVFRALRLRRRLFPRRRSPFVAIGQTLREIVTSKTLIAWASILVMIMMLTAAFTAPSFEQGVALLLYGSRAGVVRVHHAPPNVHHTLPSSSLMSALRVFDYESHPTQDSLLAAAHMLSFPLYWPKWIPANYSLDSIKVYDYSYDAWADGPVVDLVYNIDATHAAPKGTGQIVVREFKPLVQVLQVVQDKYAFPIDADQYGENAQAIYVDGQWVPTDKMPLRVWEHGGRSEIIYQQDGVVFWIAGDQRDGINEQALWKMAQTLQNGSPMNYPLLKYVRATIYLPDTIDATYDPFAFDIISIASPDGSPGQYYMTMSAYATGKLGLTNRH